MSKVKIRVNMEDASGALGVSLFESTYDLSNILATLASLPATTPPPVPPVTEPAPPENFLPVAHRSGSTDGNWQSMEFRIDLADGSYKFVATATATKWTNMVFSVNDVQITRARGDTPFEYVAEFKANGPTKIVIGANEGTGRITYEGGSITKVAATVSEPTPAPAPAPTPTPAPAPVPSPSTSGFMFVNVAGAEFGAERSTDIIWQDYMYVDDKYIDDLFTATDWAGIRFPVMWRRLQRTIRGALHGPDIDQLRRVVARVTGKGKVIIIDSHDYGRRTNVNSPDIIDASAITSDDYADYFGKLAAEFKSNDLVWFNTNEPHDQNEDAWFKTGQKIVTAIRNAGAKGKILMPGSNWTGAHSWVGGNGPAYDRNPIVDPLKNIAFDMHQYFDGNSSGTSASTTFEAGNRILAAMAWCEARGLQMFIGEWAFVNDAAGHREAERMIQNARAKPNVVIGFAYWADGQWWGSDWNIIGSGKPNGQLATIRKYL